ncbi:RelA/SpoT domain-containing protein [Novosphingobium resinovorum]|uniref:RelA/SpoT domain-containing protein n=1 Tax=Novosphingobium resinovorum TaxID=158500 RepID=UPI0009F39E0B|nr:RelA/SpoT domain-containing protein [Novosphingobium resinovorum]
MSLRPRLKRRPTIENKLRRFPDMQLSRMHDIAGCRIIFPTVEELLDFRAHFHKARFKHKRRGAGQEGRWNYLTHPKPDGYRGIHEVYEYDVRSEGGKTWNGLNVEIQFRTIIQHAWSTAVEVAGLLTHDKPKFGQGNEILIEQFRLASELLARRYEGSTSCYPDIPLENLIDRFHFCEIETRIIDLFRRVNTKVVDIDFRKNNILVFPYVPENEENASNLEVYSYSNVFRAIQRYNELEDELQNKADVVLVRADTFENVRVTFRNYFADTTDFVSLLDGAVQF